MKKKRAAVFKALAPALLMIAMLCGCGVGKGETALPEPSFAAAPAGLPAPSGQPEAGTGTGRLDGEHFEGTVILEGMEETVRYEHVRNEDIGFELDYEYEALERHRAPDCEYFLSRYDDPDDPWNYLEVSSREDGADAVAAAVLAELSDDFDTVTASSLTLDLAGECSRLDASGAKAGRMPAGALTSMYIIPAADGCRVAAAHYTLESAEGFGARFAAMMNTLIVTEAAAPSA